MRLRQTDAEGQRGRIVPLGVERAMQRLEYPGVDHCVGLEGGDGLKAICRRPAWNENHGLLLDQSGPGPSHDNIGLLAGAMHAQHHRRSLRPVLKLKPIGSVLVERAENRQGALHSRGLGRQSGAGFDHRSHCSRQIGLVLNGADRGGQAVTQRQPKSLQAPELSGRRRRSATPVGAVNSQHQMSGVQGGHFGGSAAALGRLDQAGLADFTCHVVEDASVASVNLRQSVYQSRKARHSITPARLGASSICVLRRMRGGVDPSSATKKGFAMSDYETLHGFCLASAAIAATPGDLIIAAREPMALMGFEPDHLGLLAIGAPLFVDAATPCLRASVQRHCLGLGEPSAFRTALAERMGLNMTKVEDRRLGDVEINAWIARFTLVRLRSHPHGPRLPETRLGWLNPPPTSGAVRRSDRGRSE